MLAVCCRKFVLLLLVLSLGSCDINIPMGGCEYTVRSHSVRIWTTDLTGSSPRVVFADSVSTTAYIDNLYEGSGPFFLEDSNDALVSHKRQLLRVDLRSAPSSRLLHAFEDVPETDHRPSSDGSRIVFIRADPDEPVSIYGFRYPELWVMNGDGSNRKRVPTPCPDADDPALIAACSHARPHLLPDNSGIVHLTFYYLHELQADSSPGALRRTEVSLVLTGLDGSRRLLASGINHELGSFTLHPVGHSLVFERGGNDQGLYAMRLDRDPETAVRLGDGGSPYYLLSGREIVYKSYYGEIWIMNADGTGQQRLTGPEERVADFEATPDGQRIIYLRLADLSSGVTGVWSIGTDGSDLHKVIDHSVLGLPQSGLSRLDVAPDGSRILFVTESERCQACC